MAVAALIISIFALLGLLLILLPGPPQRPLRRQSQPVQQPAHRHRRHGDAELAADQLADGVPGPQRTAELQLPRIRPDESVERWRSWAADSFGGRPGTGLARSASVPPSR